MDAKGQGVAVGKGRAIAPLIALYLVLFASCTYLVASSELQRLEREFNSTAKELFRQIDLQLRTFEICLNGFANYVDTQATPDHDNLRRFAQSLRLSYPDLYMLELAERVEADERVAFEQRMRSALGRQDFAIHHFGYDSDRQIQPAAGSDHYVPITLIEPFSEDVAPVLGLDLNGTSATLRRALEAIKDKQQYASAMFELAEGGMGFLLYRAAHLDATPNAVFNYVAIAVVRVADLIPAWLIESNRWQASLVMGNSQQLQMENFPTNLRERTGLSHWLPTLSADARLNSSVVPVAVNLRFQPRIEDLDLRIISMVTLLLLVLGWFFLRWIRQTRNHVDHAAGFLQEMISQAHYDSLTGLPNANLLMDRLEQSLRQAERNGQSIALCYMDFNRFKSINDRYGHDAGDELLCQGAHRISNCLRNEDTVSRIHGDEFIVLLPSVSQLSDAHQVADKIRSAFDDLFYIKQHALEVGISCGVAIYPEDGADAETLIAVADQRMYEDKETPVREDRWFQQLGG